MRFEVADITDLPRWPARYGLVVDSFCLHNLLADADRRRTLATVRSLLRPDGYFVVGTSVFDAGRDYGSDTRDEQTGIVYSPLPGDSIDYSDAVQIDGAWFYAKVRHVPPSDLRAELEVAGFRVLEQQGGRVLCAPEAVAV